MTVILIVQCVLFGACLLLMLKLISISVYDRDQMQEILKQAIEAIKKFNKTQEEDADFIDYLAQKEFEEQQNKKRH